MGRSRALCQRVRHAAPASLVLVIALTTLSGCTSSARSANTSAHAITVTERDFHVAVTPATVSAGDAVISLRNQGPTNHELIVVRAGSGPLPVRADGVTIDEEALESATVGALEPGTPGKDRDLEVHLEPGRYELFCNMAGHFFGGMHTTLVVT